MPGVSNRQTKRFVIIVFFLILDALSIAKVDYCDKSLCQKGVVHTMCKYAEEGMPICRVQDKTFLNKREKLWILEMHNTVRQAVALGQKYKSATGEPQPNSGNMMKLVWCSELAMIAKRWASQCQGLHDECRTYHDGSTVGQNSYIGKYRYKHEIPSDLELSTRVYSVIKKWEIEAVNVDPDKVTHFNIEDFQNATNFSQMVWAESSFIGCGYSEFILPNQTKLFKFVCNYKKSGNIDGKPLYSIGSACSSCPKKTECIRSATWFGLCWDGSENDIVERYLNSANVQFGGVLLLIFCDYIIVTLILPILTVR